MENRSQVRTPEEIVVWLYQNDSLTARAKAKDFTEEGMYIQTNGLLFPKNCAVDVVFSSFDDNSTQRKKAQVVHRTLNGIGVKFKTAI